MVIYRRANGRPLQKENNKPIWERAKQQKANKTCENKEKGQMQWQIHHVVIHYGVNNQK